MGTCIRHKLHLAISQRCVIFDGIFIIFSQFWKWQFMLCKTYLSILQSALAGRLEWKAT